MAKKQQRRKGKTATRRPSSRSTESAPGRPRPFRILSIDGGGIRGLIPARLIQHLEDRLERPIAECFDLIAGTSTGGILACGLTVPGDDGSPRYRASDLAALYRDHGLQIFPRPTWRRLPLAGFVADTFDERYPSNGLEEALEQYFGDAMLSGTVTPLLVTSYAIERRMPFLFKTTNAVERGGSHDFLLRDVARATSAAPTYFEPAVLENDSRRHDYYALVDGGVFANNPSMCAVAEALGPNHRQQLDRVELVSLGTGQMVRPIPVGEARGWGLAGWVRPVLGVMMDGMADSVEYQCLQLLPRAGQRERYVRVDGKLSDVNDDMDDATEKNIRDIDRFVDRLIREKRRELDAIVAMLTD